jgi:hypothetical protein
MADGEDANGFADAVEFHLRSCATCRAKLRAYRAIPGRVFDLMPAGPLLDHSVGGGPHEWIAERAAAALDKVRETAYSVLSRGGGGSGEVTTLATAGGTRGAGVAAVAKVLAICGATAAGGATCVATGLVHPGAVDGGPSGQKQALERPTKPAKPTATTVPAVKPARPTETDHVATTDVGATAPVDQEPTPVQQKVRQFSFESTPKATSSSTASGGGEFGGPSGGGGGSTGSGGSGSGFGIEK